MGRFLLASYVHGLDLISQNQAGAKSFYHYDGLGSTRALSDNLGAVTDSYLYDAFGRLIGSVGSTGNLYLYAGEQYDSTAGLYYNRARYLDTGVGRFVSRDSFEGRLNEPVTLHKYLYGNGNPVNMIDPSGMFSLIAVTQTLAIGGIVTGIASGLLTIGSLATGRGVVESEFLLGSVVFGQGGAFPGNVAAELLVIKTQPANIGGVSDSFIGVGGIVSFGVFGELLGGVSQRSVSLTLGSAITPGIFGRSATTFKAGFSGPVVLSGLSSPGILNFGIGGGVIGFSLANTTGVGAAVDSSSGVTFRLTSGFALVPYLERCSNLPSIICDSLDTVFEVGSIPSDLLADFLAQTIF